ncbi:MAG: DUF4105 domain-containing protein [Gemmatimonadaceae bacterium]|nr:DUF4105 domain-containing protein [Gemmatimonadaceae bacterium]
MTRASFGAARSRRWRRRWLALGLAMASAIGLAGSSRAGAQPTVAAPGAAATPASRYAIYLLTMGQGDALWEKFGHNALVVRDRQTGQGVAWNWGVFDFAAPDFLSRFLTGDTRYWMAPDDFAATLDRYRWLNRSLVLQELAIPDSAVGPLLAAISANARDDAKYYRYDYFLDNCSTRVRDAINRATGGALERTLRNRAAGTTYRRETMRLLSTMPAAAIGVDVALGARADRPLSDWEASFVPMTLRDGVRAVRMPDGAGGTQPLVRREEALFTATRPAESAAPTAYAPLLALAGLVGAALLLALSRSTATSARLATTGLAVLWSLVAGVVGVVLLLAATVTRHVFWGANANLLLFSPLALVLVVVLPLALRRPAVGVVARGVAMGVVASAAVGVVVALAMHQPIAATAAVALPLHVATVLAVRRLSGGASRAG